MSEHSGRARIPEVRKKFSVDLIALPRRAPIEIEREEEARSEILITGNLWETSDQEAEPVGTPTGDVLR
jgi:hypothetical protein